MAEEAIKQKAVEFGNSNQIYPNLKEEWLKACEQNKYDKTVVYAMQLIKALNDGKSIESVQKIYEGQGYSGRAGLKTLNVVARFAKENKGIDLFQAVEPKYTSAANVAKKLESYKTGIKYGEVKEFREKLEKQKDELNALSKDFSSKKNEFEQRINKLNKYIADCKDKTSALYDMGYLLQAIRLINALETGASMEDIKLDNSLHDEVIAKIIHDIGPKNVLTQLVLKKAVSREIVSKVNAKVADEDRYRRMGNPGLTTLNEQKGGIVKS